MAEDTTNRAKRNDKLVENNLQHNKWLTALIYNQLLQIIKKKMKNNDDNSS